MAEGEASDLRWDEFSRDYDAIFLEDPLYADTLALIAQMLGDANGKSLLELGCGTGNLVVAVLKAHPEAHVVGIDPSEGMRARCAAKFSGDERVEVQAGDALHLPFPDAHFDFIASNYTLHHLSPGERQLCAREMARVLKPGGTLFYSDFFTSVEAPPDDPARMRDIIQTMLAQALYSLERGATELTMIKIRTLPAVLEADGEYYTTLEEWAAVLESADFTDMNPVEVPPGGFGLYILKAIRSADV